MATNRKRLDRFATHRKICDRIPALRRAGAGWFLVTLAFYLWDRCDGRTGFIAKSARSIARELGVGHGAVLRDMKKLADAGLLVADKDKDGNARPGRWRVWHAVKAAGE